MRPERQRLPLVPSQTLVLVLVLVPAPRLAASCRRTQPR